MENYIFKGKYVDKTINRFEENIKGIDRVLKIPSEMELKVFISGILHRNEIITQSIKKYDAICFDNIELDEDLIISTMNLNKSIFINANKILKFNKGQSEKSFDIISKAFKVINCDQNNVYPLEYLYRNMANGEFRNIYIYANHEKYIESISNKLSDLKEVFCLDIDFDNTKKVIQMLDINYQNGNVLNDIKFIMLDNPSKKEYYNDVNTGKRRARYVQIDNEEFDSIAFQLKQLNYPSIICDSMTKRTVNGKNFDLIIHMLAQNVVRININNRK